MNAMWNAKAAGRVAGLVYLVIIVFSIAGYVPMTRLLAGDPQAVLERLVANHAQFDLAFAAMAIGFVAWVVLGFLLYRLMSSSGRLSGLLMVTFTLAGVAMSLIALAHLFPLVSSSDLGTDAGVLAPMVRDYERVLLLAQVFSGLWLFPFGWLVLRSRMAPAFLGVSLMVAGFFYLLQFATAFEPSLDQTTVFRIVSTVSGVAVMIGEFGICLWLLIKGAREPSTDEPR